MANQIEGAERRYKQKWNFRVDIDGVTAARFMKCSELKKTIGVVKQPEGGRMVDLKEPGKIDFGNVTLTYGSSDFRALWDWSEAIGSGANGTGLEPTDKRSVALIQLNRDGSEAKRWNLFKAWPSVFSAGEWDAGAEEVTVESVTLEFEYFDLDQPNAP